jgi:predicted nucleotidyltransferase component of viral defense system
MNLSGTDFNRLYLLQDKFLSWFHTLDYPFYLTGGTALGRFYLYHRFSEDLDFFVNNDPDYRGYIGEVMNKITPHFSVNIDQSLLTEDYARFFVNEDDISLKVELINDVPYYAGKAMPYRYGKVDNPLNILANKLTSIVGRDEPKDMFDIIHISCSYSFDWKEVFHHAKQKVVINELDVEQRMISFPVKWFQNVNWLLTAPDTDPLDRFVKMIADDFLLGRANSLGEGKIPIELALPVSF